MEVNRNSLLINRNRSASAFEKVITTSRDPIVADRAIIVPTVIAAEKAGWAEIPANCGAARLIL